MSEILVAAFFVLLDTMSRSGKEKYIAIELMQESHDQRVLIKSYLVPIFISF